MGEMDRDYFIERDRSFTAQLHARVDQDLPGRLFRGLKALSGGRVNRIRVLSVFDKTFKLEALLNMLLRTILDASRAEEEGVVLPFSSYRAVLCVTKGARMIRAAGP